MTKEEKQRKIIEEHYRKIPGYPKIGVQKVYDELQNVWNLLIDNNCKPDISVEEFISIVRQTQMEALMQSEIARATPMYKYPTQKIQVEVVSSKIFENKNEKT